MSNNNNMSVTRDIQRQVKRRLHKNGTMARIAERARILNEEARKLGYPNAQTAFNALGKSFLESVKRDRPL